MIDRALKNRLAASPFRSRFRLTCAERGALAAKGRARIRMETERFVRQRLATAFPVNDGKQTPMRGHPVFKAQHATACCCRACLARWHGIAAGRPLSEAEIAYVTDVILNWLEEQAGDLAGFQYTPDLFGDGEGEGA